LHLDARIGDDAFRFAGDLERLQREDRQQNECRRVNEDRPRIGRRKSPPVAGVPAHEAMYRSHGSFAFAIGSASGARNFVSRAGPTPRSPQVGETCWRE
jgi:hypothetical protein